MAITSRLQTLTLRANLTCFELGLTGAPDALTKASTCVVLAFPDWWISAATGKAGDVGPDPRLHSYPPTSATTRYRKQYHQKTLRKGGT